MRFPPILVAAVLAALAVGCGTSGETPVDAAAPEDVAASDTAAPEDVAPGVGGLPGAYVCTMAPIRPVNFQQFTDFGECPCPIYPDGRLLAFATAVGDGGQRALVGGMGSPLPDAGPPPQVPLTASWFHLDGLRARVPLAPQGDGGFVTDPGGQVFEWDYPVWAQPPLHLRDVVITGGIGADGRPVTHYGSIVGCFTPASAEAIWFDVLSQTFLQLIESTAGTALDCDATGGGGVDGYTFEVMWWVQEAVDVFE